VFPTSLTVPDEQRPLALAAVVGQYRPAEDLCHACGVAWGCKVV
jgi:hypothetical protein